VFDARAERFDAIFTGAAGPLRNAWNHVARENVRWRLGFALEAAGDLQGKRVLDVGCGPGRCAVEAAKRGARAMGVDFAPGMVALARRVASAEGVSARCEFVQADVIRHDFGRPFDVVIANGFFDYIVDPAPMLASLRRVTAGRLIAAFPLRGTFRAPFRRLWRWLQRCELKLYGVREIEELASGAGFRVVRVVRHGPIAMLVAEPAGRPAA